MACSTLALTDRIESTPILAHWRAGFCIYLWLSAKKLIYIGAENTFYRWRKTSGGMSVSAALKELEKENARLKRLLAERMLEVDALKELLGKKA
jgi:hypothetical protein